MTVIRKYSDYIILLLLIIILILVLVIITDMHIAGINREFKSTSFNHPLNTLL